MDPFSLVVFAVGAAVGGVIGNRADDAFCQVVGTVIERLRRGGPPVNHDLQRSVRRAHLQATLAVCEAFLKELGVAPSLWRRDLGVLFRPTDEIRWLDRVHAAIREELRQLPRADYVPPPTEADKQVELLLQPKGTNGNQRKEELCAMLKQGLLEELRRQRHGEPPDRFVEMVQQGWDDVVPDGTRAHLDWFDLLCAFFIHDLKTNERVRTIFEAQLLAQLTVEGTPLTLIQFEKLSEGMVKRLEQLDAHLAQLRTEQAQGFASVQDRLDEALPLLLYLPDIGTKQQTAIEMLQAILEILKPLPLPKPDYAAYLQRLRERLRELTARECALFRLADFDPLTDALPLQLAEVKPDSPFGLPSRDDARSAAEEILAKHPRLVIVADGGAGKTTLTRRWACALAERALTDSTAPVPVYVEMNLYQQGKLHELIAASVELDAEALQAELCAGRFTLLFDGLNEVAADAYTDAVRELRTLLSHDDGNRVLVTTRKHGYKDDLRLPTFAVEPLREDDIRAFVAARLGSEQKTEKGAALAKQLLSDARLRSLAENPMMLTMLTAIVGQAGDLPRNRGQLFKAFMDGVFAWEEQSLKAGETHLDRSIKESCLATVAYRLTEQGKVAADKLTIGNWIADKLDELRLKKLDWTDVYGELLRNGLLVRSGTQFGFFHTEAQEYFSAVELLKFPTEQVVNFVNVVEFDPITGDYLTDTKWYEPVIMLCGLVDDVASIVNGLIDRDVLLAAACFSQSHTEQSTLRGRLVEKLVSAFEHERRAYVPGGTLRLSYFAMQQVLGLMDFDELWMVGFRLVRYWKWILELADSSVSRETFGKIASYGLEKDDEILQGWAARCVAKIDAETAREFFSFVLFATEGEIDVQEDDRLSAALALATLGTREAWNILDDAARDTALSREIRKSAAFALGECAREYGELSIATLETLTREPDHEVAQAARNAIAAIRRCLGLTEENEQSKSPEGDSG